MEPRKEVCEGGVAPVSRGSSETHGAGICSGGDAQGGVTQSKRELTN